MTTKSLFRSALLLGVLTLAGCKSGGTVSIRALLDDPSQYDHKLVRIAGTVTHSIGLMGFGGYSVDDGTGVLPVVSQTNGAPREGARVGVEGEFRSAFTVGQTTGAVLMEQKRKTR
jgi:hypothetical protein